MYFYHCSVLPGNNPSSGSSFTVVFEENNTEKSYREIPLELYFSSAIWANGTRHVNVYSAGLPYNHPCYFNERIAVAEMQVARLVGVL